MEPQITTGCAENGFFRTLRVCDDFRMPPSSLMAVDATRPIGGERHPRPTDVLKCPLSPPRGAARTRCSIFRPAVLPAHGVGGAWKHTAHRPAREGPD